MNCLNRYLLKSLLLIPLFLTSCYNPSVSDIMGDLIALEGEWDSYKGVKFSENWRVVDDHHLQGEGFSLNGADTVFFETLSIIRESDSIYYSISFAEENGDVNFLLTEATKNSWTFINPENAFPSIIVYQIEKDSLLTVTISNIRGNKEQFFYLKKVDFSTSL